MLTVTEVAFTGYSVTDVPRAFYEEVLGLKPGMVFDEEGGRCWIEYEIGPHTLAITNISPDWKPSRDGGGVALEVADFEEALDWLKSNGVTPYAGPIESPGCRFVLVDDPDGNSICIHKRKDAPAPPAAGS